MSTVGWTKSNCKGNHGPNRERYKSGACVLCQRERADRRYKEDPTAQKERTIARALRHPDVRRDEQRAWRRGTSVKEIRAIIDASGGRCGACGTTLVNRAMCIDHDHKTGKLRGVLCRFCNALEGMLNKQSKRVRQVQAYLNRYISELEAPK